VLGIAVATGAAALLDHVGDLVSKDEHAIGTADGVGERNVVADRERACAELARMALRTLAGMQADVGE